MSCPSQPLAIVALAAEARTLAGVGVPLEIRISGPGPAAAQRSALAAMVSAPPWILSWGVAGALDPRLRPGTIIRPAEVVAASGEVFACSAAGLPAQRLASSPRPIRSRTARRDLAERSGAVAVDMESAAIAAVCRDAGIPFVCVRAIADGYDVELPAWIDTAMTATGALDPWPVVRRLLTEPSALSALLRAGLGFRRALASLARAARHGGFPSPGEPGG